MNIEFILVEPAVPENIGASARAIKTMGFRTLKLINPFDHLHVKSRMLAHGSQDVLEEAEIFDNLKDALEGIDFTIGATAKKRSVKFDYYDSRDIPGIVERKIGAVKNIALVFGREESGLTNEELKLCDLATSVSLDDPYPSLNLAQSVMIYAYLLSPLQLHTKKVAHEKDPSEWAALKEKTKDLLHRLEIDANPNLSARIMERLAAMNKDDIHLALSFISKLEEKAG